MVNKSNKPHHRYYENNPNVPKLSWLDLLGRDAVSSDGHDLGKIEAVNSEFAVIKKGMREVVRYWVPAKVMEQGSSVASGNRLEFSLTLDQTESYKKKDIPNPANFATLGASTSHLAYPPIPYLPDEMLKEKYRQQKPGSGKNPKDES